MSASQERQPTLDSVAPRFLVGDMEQALAFYGQLGFATPYHDEGFAIIERDGIALQFDVSDPTQEPPKESCRVCYIGVTNIEAFYYVLGTLGKIALLTCQTQVADPVRPAVGLWMNVLNLQGNVLLTAN